MKTQRFVYIVFSIALIAPASVGPIGAQSSEKHPVSAEQYQRWKTELSNWGRWGKDDKLGTLNLITAEKRKAAAALVRDGVSVSLSLELNKTAGRDAQ